MSGKTLEGTPSITFELVVRKNGTAVLTQPLSFGAMSSIISDARDSADNAQLFRLAAEHPSIDVRQNVAYKDKLDEGTLAMLAADPCVTVTRNLVRSAAFKQWVSKEQLLDLLNADVEIAESVANSVNEYENADSSVLAPVLAGMMDPKVRHALVSSYSIPKSIAKRFVSDPDPSVRAAAQERIQNG